MLQTSSKGVQDLTRLGEKGNSQGIQLEIKIWPYYHMVYAKQVVWVWVMVIFRWLFLFSSIEANLIDEQQ